MAETRQQFLGRIKPMLIENTTSYMAMGCTHVGGFDCAQKMREYLVALANDEKAIKPIRACNPGNRSEPCLAGKLPG
jgi:hypothetical protein